MLPIWIALYNPLYSLAILLKVKSSRLGMNRDEPIQVEG